MQLSDSIKIKNAGSSPTSTEAQKVVDIVQKGTVPGVKLNTPGSSKVAKTNSRF